MVGRALYVSDSSWASSVTLASSCAFRLPDKTRRGFAEKHCRALGEVRAHGLPNGCRLGVKSCGAPEHARLHAFTDRCSNRRVHLPAPPGHLVGPRRRSSPRLHGRLQPLQPLRRQDVSKPSDGVCVAVVKLPGGHVQPSPNTQVPKSLLVVTRRSNLHRHLRLHRCRAQS